MNTAQTIPFPFEPFPDLERVTDDMTDQERQAALEFGKSASLTEAIVSDYERIGLVGEHHNKLLCYVAAISRKMDNCLCVMAISSSGAGKSVLQDKTLRLCPP